MPLKQADDGYRILPNGSRLTFEVRWTEAVRGGARDDEHVTKGRLDGVPVSDSELEELLAD